MKRLLLLVAAAVSWISTASATMYQDVIEFTGGNGALNIFHSVTGEFDLTGGTPNSLDVSAYPVDVDSYSDVLGFDPNSEYAYRGSFSFYIRDANSPLPILYTVDLDDSLFDLGLAWPGQFKVVSSTLGFNLLAEINDTGKLSFEISTVVPGASYYVDGARLEIDAVPKSVPDGGSTVALLGVALVGIHIARRKFLVA